jgi:hypothetical protein
VTASEKIHLLRCASSLVTAVYETVRLVPRESRALPLELFTERFRVGCYINLLWNRYEWF